MFKFIIKFMHITEVKSIVFQHGDIILTHRPFGLFSFLINGTDYALYLFKKFVAFLAKICFDIKLDIPPFVKIDHIARIGQVWNFEDGRQFFELYETVAINKQKQFFSFKRWKGGTIATQLYSIKGLHNHFKHKKLYVKQLKNPLTTEQYTLMLKDLELQVQKTSLGLNKYSWKYVIISPFDIFFSRKKRPNKDSIKHINYCQMLIKKNNIAIGLEVYNNKDVLESPYQEISKDFYSPELFYLLH